MMAYRGRFAPSPTGPLHAGSLVAALASWLDARVHAGHWLVRIEDVDTLRCASGAQAIILTQLSACGLLSDETPERQSGRGPLYQVALERLLAAGRAYPCGCSRREIASALAALGRPHEHGAELVYPGTCRGGLGGRTPRAWRFRVGDSVTNESEVHWTDRRLGPQRQDVALLVGDFILKRSDGPWAYQLAMVVDDAAQGITHVVRGEDLADNTARQILLQRALGLPTPAYLHTPLVLDADGRKLSKQHGAAPLDPGNPLGALRHAGGLLGLPVTTTMDDTPADWLARAVPLWARRWRLAASRTIAS